MLGYIATITTFVSIGVVLINIFMIWSIGYLLLGYFRPTAINGSNGIARFLSTHALSIVFVMSLGALLGSLFYSKIAGFAPCDLCIAQRAYMYPIVGFTLAALIASFEAYKRALIAIIVALSVSGAFIALYHYWGQMFAVSMLPCTANAVSCAKREFVEFGYITIPLMSLTVFLGNLIVLAFYARGGK